MSSFVCLRRDGGFSERTDCTAATLTLPQNQQAFHWASSSHFPDGEKFSRRPDFRITFFTSFLKTTILRTFLAPKTLTDGYQLGEERDFTKRDPAGGKHSLATTATWGGELYFCYRRRRRQCGSGGRRTHRKVKIFTAIPPGGTGTSVYTEPHRKSDTFVRGYTLASEYRRFSPEFYHFSWSNIETRLHWLAKRNHSCARR